MRSAIVFVCAWLLFIAGAASAEEPVRRVSVMGYSHISVAPNQATVNLTVRQISKESAESRKLVLQSMKAIARALKQQGVSDKKITQSHISQGKHSEWQNGTHVDLGFYSQVMLMVMVDDLDALSGVYDALARFSEVQINHTQFKHAERKKLEDEQRRMAILNAKERAAAMVAVLNESLGPVLSIAENQMVSHPPIPMQRAAFAEAEAPNIEFGNIEIQARVAVEFAIK